MQTKVLVMNIAAVGVLTTLIHARAVALSWYWSFWWMDVLVHFLAGLFVGLVALWVLAHRRGFSLHSLRSLVVTLGAVILVGIGWEIFEYSMDVLIFQKYTFSTISLYILIDSLHDLANDLLGAALAWRLLRKRGGK